MNKKLFCLLAITVALFAIDCNSSFAITPVTKNAQNMTVDIQEDELENTEKSIIDRISFRNKFKRSPEAQIKSVFRKYTKYSEKNDLKKLRELYSDSYVNNDGFNKESLFKLMKEASDSYKNVTYNTEILKIEVDGLYASVKVNETAVGETLKKTQKIDDVGKISSEINFTDYLRKENGKWKIYSTIINSEQVSLVYGEAKKALMTVHAPKVIPANTQYEVSTRVEAPDGVIIVGSIVNEEIKYPQNPSKDVLRAVKYEELARLLKSNNNNHNEYATVSLGFVRPHVGEEGVAINMTGMAIVMSRVNVLQKNNVKLSIKEISNAKTTTKK